MTEKSPIATVEDIIKTSEEMRTELDKLQNSEERGQELEQALKKAYATAYKSAHTLSQARRTAALARLRSPAAS